MTGTRHWGYLQALVAFFGMGVMLCSSTVIAAPAVNPKNTKAGDVVTPKLLQPGVSAQPGEEKTEPVFARVNNRPIAVREYNRLLSEIMRKRYYHGTVPQDKVEPLYQEITDLAVERELLLGEAEKRGIKPDPATLEKELADLDKRNGANPKWKEQRERYLPMITENVGRQSMLDQLEKAVRDVPQPTPVEIRAYYDKHPELFTEPERLKLSIILLKVDPGGTKDEWELARAEAQKIYDRIKGGADFADQARLHSQHDSAAKGGDMGYLHGGMLPRGMEGKIGEYQVGVVNEPIRTLEGIVVPKVDERIPPQLREFSAVEKRARDLLIRSRADEAWQKTIDQLRAGAKIEILTPQLLGGK